MRGQRGQRVCLATRWATSGQGPHGPRAVGCVARGIATVDASEGCFARDAHGKRHADIEPSRVGHGMQRDARPSGHRTPGAVRLAPRRSAREAHLRVSSDFQSQLPFRQKKPFLQCLATLEQLLDRGLSSLLPGLPTAYYKLLLRATRPQDIPVNHTAVEYTRLLALKGPVSLDEADSPSEIVPLDNWASSDVPMSAPASGMDTPWQARARGHAHGQRAAIAAHHAGSAMWPATQRMLKKAKTAEASLRAAPLHDAPRDDLGSGLAGPSGAASGAAKKRKRGSSSQRVGQIEGQELRLEERGSEGARGSYRRYIVTCPYHTDADTLCWKKRNTGKTQTKSLGQAEPRIYLGTWLSRAADYVTRKDHMDWKPGLADVRAYAKRNNML